MSEPRFKPCMQRQPMLLPPDVSDLIPGNSMVRIVDAIVDGMDRRTLESVYPGGGAPAYDPAMMLKVVLYAYASGVYSSRRIARAASENICFMWLTGMRPLSHSTVNRFRSERIRPVFEDSDSYRRRASALLHTERGSALRKRRGVDVETVFGDIKRNLGFARFTLRGLEKVELEWRLVATGHNIRKMFLARTGAEAGA